MKQKFLICKHCGNIVAMIRDKGVPVYCCAEQMQELIPGTTEASGENLQRTSEFVMNVIDHTRTNGEKSICFVTGVPGAGKTLVGLNIAVRQFEKKDLAVYLSGNQPLVDVLSEALARDKKRQEEERNPNVRYTLTEARRNVKSFIQME